MADCCFRAIFFWWGDCILLLDPCCWLPTCVVPLILHHYVGGPICIFVVGWIQVDLGRWRSPFTHEDAINLWRGMNLSKGLVERIWWEDSWDSFSASQEILESRSSQENLSTIRPIRLQDFRGFLERISWEDLFSDIDRGYSTWDMGSQITTDVIQWLP